MLRLGLFSMSQLGKDKGAPNPLWLEEHLRSMQIAKCMGERALTGGRVKRFDPSMSHSDWRLDPSVE